MAVRLIDAHLHLWDTKRRDYAWLEEFPTINGVHLMDEFNRAKGEVDVQKAVFVECAGATDEIAARDEVTWVQAISAKNPRIAGIVAYAPLEKGEEGAGHLDWLREQSLVKGARRLLQGESDPMFCLGAGFVEGVQLLAEYDLSFDACILHFQMEGLIRLVEQCPNVQIVLDHLGKPAIKDRQMDPWREHIGALASFSNTYCKISGALTEADHFHWTESDVIPYLEIAIDAFGERRIMFGGDWPVVNLAGSYTQWLDVVQNALSQFSEFQTEKFFSENAASFYRLNDD